MATPRLPIGRLQTAAQQPCTHQTAVKLSLQDKKRDTSLALGFLLWEKTNAGGNMRAAEKSGTFLTTTAALRLRSFRNVQKKGKKLLGSGSYLPLLEILLVLGRFIPIRLSKLLRGIRTRCTHTA